jgi:ankyrin repeat protein
LFNKTCINTKNAYIRVKVTCSKQKGTTMKQLTKILGLCTLFACKSAVGAHIVEVAAGDTPLHIALRTAVDTNPTIEDLLAQGANVNAQNKSGDTPLHIAARNGASSAVIARLLAAGASANACNCVGATPLHKVVRSITTGDGTEREINIIRLLVSAGALRKIRNERGLRPVDIAARLGYKSLIAELTPPAGLDL